MKLRIKGDSLRLRVSRSELDRVLHGERVEDTIHFSMSPDAQLTYGLESALQSEPVRIECGPQNVTVLLSKEQTTIWERDSEIGVYGSIEVGQSGSLQVSIEKDFACLDRSDEENADTFINPHSNAICITSDQPSCKHEHLQSV